MKGLDNYIETYSLTEDEELILDDREYEAYCTYQDILEEERKASEAEDFLDD